MDDQVAKWVETSGRGLELRVARAFHRVGARVEPSFIYEDVRTGTSREGDVLATFEWLSPSKAAMHLEVVVECKHSANKPWVAFYDRTTPRDITNINSWVRFAHGSQVGLTEPLGDLWAARPPFDWGQVATHIVTALADDRNNPSNDAVRQVLSAAASRRDVYLKTQQEALHKPRAVVVIALVVITGPLYECRLSPSGQVEPEFGQISAQPGHGGWRSGRPRGRRVAVPRR